MEHSVRLVVADDHDRNRLTVFFRPILAIPHFIWLYLWGIVAALALIGSWFATLVMGRTPAGLHNFLANYLRYSTHVGAYMYFLAQPYPGFMGEPGYSVDLEVDPPVEQDRWTTFFRLILAVPALILTTALGYVLGAIGIFGWFTGVFLGRMPRGLRSLGCYGMRVQAQAHAYVGLLTPRYPEFSPKDA